MAVGSTVRSLVGADDDDDAVFQIERVLNVDVDTIVVFFGLHEPNDTKYQQQMRSLAVQLDAWAAKDPKRLAFFREMSAQHFPGCVTETPRPVCKDGHEERGTSHGRVKLGQATAWHAAIDQVTALSLSNSKRRGAVPCKQHDTVRRRRR